MKRRLRANPSIRARRITSARQSARRSSIATRRSTSSDRMAGPHRRLAPALVVFAMLLCGGVTSAQTPHDHGAMPMPDSTSGWHFMQDGILFAGWNHQGGPRGGDEFVAPNWWMGMASRDTSRGRLTFTGML